MDSKFAMTICPWNVCVEYERTKNSSCETCNRTPCIQKSEGLSFVCIRVRGFLGAEKHLYKMVRPSVRRTLRRSVTPARFRRFPKFRVVQSTAWPCQYWLLFFVNNVKDTVSRRFASIKFFSGPCASTHELVFYFCP